MWPCVPNISIESDTKLRAMRDLFDGMTIKDIDGKSRKVDSALVVSYGTSDTGMGTKMFKEIVWKSTYKTLDAADSFKDADWRRIASEIEKEAKGLRNPSLSFLEKYGFVRRGVMRKHAVTNWFNNMVNATSNYERVTHSQFMNRNREISRILRQEVLRRGGQNITFLGIKAEKNLEKLENKLFEVLHDIANAKKSSQDTIKLDAKANKIREQIVEALDKDGGDVLWDFVQYMNTAPDANRLILKKDGTKFPRAIIEAGSQAREMLNETGNVFIKGLEKHREVVNLAFLNSTKIEKNRAGTTVARRVMGYQNKIDQQIKAIEEGIEKGDYFPHYLMEAMVHIEKEMDKVYSKKEITEVDANDHLGNLERVMSRIREEIHKSPMSIKHRKNLAYDNWIKNPLSVLRKYGLDAISFNKSQNLKSVYAQTIKHMPKDSEAAHAMNKYVQDVYTLAEKGFTDRPSWVNKTVRVLTGFEFLSKIGFGIGTAARNTMSGLYFIQGLGNMKFKRYMSNWNNKANADLVDKIKKVEEESGFKFEDMAEELYTEGLVPTKGVRGSDINMSVDENGKPSFRYKEGKVWRTVDSSLSFAAGKGAIFQRVTENMLRRHMFRSSFFTKYKELQNSGVTNKNTLINRSKSFALDMVNKYAFEYAAHQKAPIAGGHKGALGATGQIIFQFFHYPMSFLQSQSEILRNSKDAVLARQWDNPDVMIPIRFAALGLMTGLMSGVFNRDFTRLLENDTVDRIKNLIDVLNGEEDVKGRGYVGPAVGDLIFLATLNEIIEMPDNVFVDLIAGYNNAYKLTDDQKRARLWSTLNVEASKIVNKHIPTLQSGGNSSILMHELGTYPRSWTKELHKKIWGKKSKLNKKGKSKDKSLYFEAPQSTVSVPKFSPAPSFTRMYTPRRRRDLLNSLNNIV